MGQLTTGPGRRAVRLARAAVAVLVLAAWVVASPEPAAAATVDFGPPSTRSTFGEGIEFRQPVTIQGAVRRVELLLDHPRAPGPEVRVVPSGPSPSTLSYNLETANGEPLPNTSLTARWRIVGEDGSLSVGPPGTVRYEDTRFAWQTRQDGVVRVHWYEGGEAFGDRALEIGSLGIQSASRLLGVTETEPVDVFIYADRTAFYDALGPGTRENVGGQANAEIRTLFALITPADISASWVENVIPHELTHLVFDTAVRNPYHFPPRWLNEGVAVYLAQGYEAGDRVEVERAAGNGSLMPLAALASQFPTTRDRFALAYAESVAAVDYLVRTKGEASLVSLVRSYAGGLTDDEAFREAIGTDVAGFDAGWRASLRARDPVVHGPRAAPPGPLPAGWTSGSPPLESGPPGATGLERVRVAVGIGILMTGLVAVTVLALRTRRDAAGPRSDDRPPGGAT